jgi:putative membrane protein
MLLSALQTRPTLDGLSALRVVLASYWGALLVAVCQVLVLYAIVHFGLGLAANTRQARSHSWVSSQRRSSR